MGKNRIIYQSEALYAGRDKPSGGYIDETGVGDVDAIQDDARPYQLQRVQSANYSFEIARQDVNQFGNLAAIDRVILDQPTVSLDFTYYINNFFNEDKLGFAINGTTVQYNSLTSSITDLLDKTADERNYYIRTVNEGFDAVAFDEDYGDTAVKANNDVIAVGNGFLSSYSSEGAVGDFPTASVTVEALNMSFDTGSSGNYLPAVNPTDGTKITDKLYNLPTGVRTSSDDATTVLKPGDITVSIYNAGSTSTEADPNVGGVDVSDSKIQSYSLNVDFGREPLQRLGNRFAFAREITFPVTASMSVDALMGDLTTGNLAEVLTHDKSYDLVVEMKKDGARHMAYVLKDAKLDSQEFSSSIGDNKGVTLNFSSQIGSKTETTVGLFMSGVHA